MAGTVVFPHAIHPSPRPRRHAEYSDEIGTFFPTNKGFHSILEDTPSLGRGNCVEGFAEHRIIQTQTVFSSSSEPDTQPWGTDRSAENSIRDENGKRGFFHLPFILPSKWRRRPLGTKAGVRVKGSWLLEDG